MSLWYTFSDDSQEFDPSPDGPYYGIFIEHPVVIAARLPRPRAPFVRYSSALSGSQGTSTGIQVMSCIEPLGSRTARSTIPIGAGVSLSSQT
jgi:hypothetical protein